MIMSKTIVLKQRPDGTPKNNDFEIINENQPSIKSGEILLKAKYVSVDPYLRGRMRDEESYIEPFKINKPIASTVVAEVVESKNEKYSEGDFLTGMLDWKEYQVHTGIICVM
ncbi:putative oxidoreductase YncB [Nonlabens ulvanivorans]|uniref:Putative oxidoreductase YncB n=1 Tax=Nonlabens ulvanivorans TaxID=906888 RepID=A0A090X330_NONUL|nr:putative oxidoreductase YncB [Nonlabens ulvanivorans]